MLQLGLLVCAVTALWTALMPLLCPDGCGDDITVILSCALEMEEGMADPSDGANAGNAELADRDWAREVCFSV